MCSLWFHGCRALNQSSRRLAASTSGFVLSLTSMPGVSRRAGVVPGPAGLRLAEAP